MHNATEELRDVICITGAEGVDLKADGDVRWLLRMGESQEESKVSWISKEQSTEFIQQEEWDGCNLDRVSCPCRRISLQLQRSLSLYINIHTKRRSLFSPLLNMHKYLFPFITPDSRLDQTRDGYLTKIWSK